MILHPSGNALQRFGDEGSEGARSKRVARHLASCARCRQEIAAVRALGDAARSAPKPEIAKDAWDRIAEQRRAGARVLLPLDDAAFVVAPSRWIKASAIAGAIAAAGVMAIVLTRGLGASPTGVLSIQPSRPRPGGEITLRYRPITVLADEPRLVVRAGFLGAGDATWVTWAFWDYYSMRPSGSEVGALTRSADGSFSGSIRLPDSVVYALFAVEDQSGEHVDADAGRLWDLVTGTPDGRPSFDGLRARASRHGLATGARALAAAESLVTFYPDSAQSWALQVERQGSSRIPHWLRVFDQRERRFATLETRLGERGSVSAAEASAMASLAASIEDSAAAERWRSRLIAEHPTDALAIVAMAGRAARSTPAVAQAELATVEAKWSAARGATPALADAGLTIALRSGDSTAIRRWTARYYRIGPPGYMWLSPSEVADSALREQAALELRAQLQQLASDSSIGRSLLTTRSRQRLYRRGLTARTLGSLAMVLLGDGRPAAARDTLDVAISLAKGMCGFDDLHAQRAAADIALRDSLSAASDLAASKRHAACSRQWAKP